ncbi:MAG TPA: L-lactate permease [Acidobacteriota bacterium]
MPWPQAYDPLHNTWLSALLASLPILILLGSLALLRIKAHFAALLGLAASLSLALLVLTMPADKALWAAGLGAAYGLFPIGWIIINIIFLYQLTQAKGSFAVMRDSLTGITRDRRLQVLLIAFCFGAFFEGAAGFGTPVAVTAAILIGLGFGPLQASGLSLIANTAPVAYGALGTPILALAAETGLEVKTLSAMVGRQLPFFSILVPFWLVWAFAGFRKMTEVWPALAVAGASYAVPQWLVSNFHGPWLVDIIASLCSMAALILFLLVWRPKRPYLLPGEEEAGRETKGSGHTRSEIIRAWLPWVVLSLVVFLWGLPRVRSFLDGIFSLQVALPALDGLILRMPPVVASPTAERAVFSFNALSFTGTGILVAALAAAVMMGLRPGRVLRIYGQTIRSLRFTLLTVAAMLALGTVTRYSGLDAMLGLAFARTGILYPFFGTLLGWLGVALTGSDTSSNVLFGSLQRISAERLGLSPVLMAAANSSGGVMGKMINAQSIVVAASATQWYGHEGEILRYVFFHSLALAGLVGILVSLQAYVFPFTRLVIP